MANENQLVRTITEPTIILDDIKAFTDEKTADERQDNTVTATKAVKQLGGITPTIQILTKIFAGEDIQSFRLNSEGQIPTCTATITINDKSFYSRSFPKDGDLMSIFIRNKDDTFKPIRNDYIITDINIIGREGAGENSNETMIVSGELFVPGLHDIKCFSKKGTSFDALKSVASDLKLGFASNDVDTSDSQTWICPYDKPKDFINEVTSSSYKDPESFFHTFIDHFYYLNFVNVEPLFGEETEIEESLMIDLYTNDYGNDSVQGKAVGKTVLTNWDEHSSTPFYILEHTLFNESASINQAFGYKRYTIYYDALLKERAQIFADPKTTEGAEEDKILLKGRPRENFYLSQFQTNWMGIQYGENGENLHENYNFAKVQNIQNVKHLGKMGLKITLQSINANLRRMQSVPVIIVIKRDTTRKVANTPADEDGSTANTDPNNPIEEKPAVDTFDAPFVIDKTVSGYYVIWSTNYIFRNGEFRQELFLVRREWPTPPTAGNFPPYSST
jgi:hypothetical protein